MCRLSLVPAHSDAGHDFNKKPAIGWQSRVFRKTILNWLEVSSRDATAAMLPNGHLSLGSLATQANIKRRRHLLTPLWNTISSEMSSISRSIS